MPVSEVHFVRVRGVCDKSFFFVFPSPIRKSTNGSVICLARLFVDAFGLRTACRIYSTNDAILFLNVNVQFLPLVKFGQICQRNEI